jgi:hypothetical protein
VNGAWVPQPIRDAIVQFINHWASRTELPVWRLVRWLGMARCTFDPWSRRLGTPDRHNGRIPRDSWLEDREQARIIAFHDTYPHEGYRQSASMMLDADIVGVSPSGVYRVLKAAGKLAARAGKPSRKGQGFERPLRPHEHWHIDVSYINIGGKFFFLCSILDGYSQPIIHREIRETMTEAEVEIIIRAWARNATTRGPSSSRGLAGRDERPVPLLTTRRRSSVECTRNQAMVKLLAGRHSRQDPCFRRESFHIILDVWKRFRSARARYKMSAPSLYRRILGARFDALPAVLRRFHDVVGGGRACGSFRIERAQGRSRNALASVLGLPRSGSEVLVQLRVEVEGERERWIRDFDGHRVVTVQWARGGLLMESIGWNSFSTELEIDGSRLRYAFRRAWFAGIPLPRGLSPSVESYVDVGETGWRVVVRIFAPFLGELVRYEGWIEPE